MERYWLETGTKLHKTYESARNYGSDYSAPDGRHEVVFYADAQATIAALQTQLGDLTVKYKNLVAWYDKQNGTPCEQVRHQQEVEALQARVQELEEWKHIVTGAGTDQESVIRLAAYEYTKIAVQCWKEANTKLQSQLTQRTAELEAAKRLATNAQWQIDYVLDEAKKAFDLKRHYTPSDLVDCVLRPAASMLKERDELKAELERVSLLSSHNERRFEMLEEKYKELRTLILTLPKVEGEIVAQAGYVKDRKKVYACFGSDADMTAYAALLTHRQGMEG